MLRLSILFLIFAITVRCHKKRYDQCIDEYFVSVGRVLSKHHVQTLRLYYETNSKQVDLPATTTQVLMDVGIGSISGPPLLFYHCMQLNIRGVHSLGTGQQSCSFEPYDPEESDAGVHLLTGGDKFVYANALHRPFGSTWLSIVRTYPQTRLLMNDIDDQTWFSNQFTIDCNASRTGPLTDKCLAPILMKINRNTMKADLLRKLILSNLKFEQAQILMGAYRSLVSCLVPGEQLFVYNHQKNSSEEYWKGLAKFLGRKIRADKLKNLLEGNSTLYPPPMVNHEECKQRPCYNYYSRKLVGPTPSVCEDPDKTPPPQVQHRFIRCATEYAAEVSNIFGQRFYRMILNRLLAAPSLVRHMPLNENRIILGIGPGTTGTTSIFTAMKQLNVTSHHYNMCGVNCAGDADNCRYYFEDDMEVLLTTPKDYPVFWADSPVIGKWWHLLKMYPSTKIIMTDIRDDNAWYRKRKREHCHRPIKKVWDSCVVPLAMEFRTGFTQQSQEFYHLVHFTNVSRANSTLAFQAYRRFVRCAVPPEQLLWIYIKEQTSSPSFWKMITSFANITVPIKVLDTLIANGIPHCGKAGCRFNKIPAHYVGRENDSAIIPSVCSLL